MPSRNKRNKSRQNANTKNTTNTTSAKTAESSASSVIVGNATESSENVTEVVEETLTKLPPIVDSKKDSISDATVTIAADEKEQQEEEAAPSTIPDEPSNEQQTMKKKRNRNRNRKKNASNANESGVSSSSGTHESSPTSSALISNPPTSNIIATKTTEEPHQFEYDASLEKIEVDSIKTESVNVIADKQPEIFGDVSNEENVEMPSKLNTDQSIVDQDNLEKTETNADEIKAGAQVFTVDEMKTDDDDQIVVVDEESLKCSTKTEKDEKPEEMPNLGGSPIEEIAIAIATNRESEHERLSEKLDAELKEEMGKSEMKHDLSGVETPSPQTKNKSNNNKKGKGSKTASNENRKIEKKPPERTKPTESVQHVKLEKEERVGEPETMNTELPKIVDDSSTVTSENVAKTPAPTPTPTSIIATPAPELPKKPIQHEDETAKIWKILEEASKGLEPVEIQMDDDPIINANDQPVIEANVPILCSPEDPQQVEEKAKDLAALLQTIETDKVKPSAQSKPKNELIQSGAKPKQTDPTKLIDSQLQKHADLTKAPKETIQTNPTPSESNLPVKVHTVQEDDSSVAICAEKKHEAARESSPEKLVEQPLPIKETSETNDIILPDTDEIPLDVSILPDHIDVPEIITDSKNVQGSGFVPSVDQTAAETESLVHETIAKSDEIEANSHTSVYSNEGNAPQPTTIQLQDNGLPSNTNNKSINKDDTKTKTEVLGQTTTQEKRRSQRSEKSNQTNCNPKNGKQPNGKPIIPPKPDNLVSSQPKKSQTVGTKSAKMEKILVLTGAGADDEDSEDDYIEYKFMPRPVFIATICQSCKKPTELNDRILCQLCHMVSYCKAEHAVKDEPQHNDLCAAFQEIAKKRGGHIYNNARILNDNDYRSLRVHTLNLCENLLKRPLQTYEREILLFPRLCSHTSCREWRPNLLADCSGCGQAFYCSAQPDHLIEAHQRWCKSVALYKNLVVRQSVSGRIEPSLPSRIQNKPYKLPSTIADVFKDLYKNYAAIKDECVFATLTQLATIPLTAYFTTQKAELRIGEKFTIHLIGAELQFEADVLDIWETFFLHLAHNLVELTIVFCGPELNAENIPLDIISRIRMCRTCRQHCRIVKFDFQCAKLYHDYAKSAAYSKPDLICFFNPGFHHINTLNTFDTWSETIKVASTSDCPVVVTSYTEYESPRDLDRFQREMANNAKKMDLIHGPSLNAYASQRPERNFISDEIVPVIFKNYFSFVLK